jgi:hypothetical protein
MLCLTTWSVSLAYVHVLKRRYTVMVALTLTVLSGCVKSIAAREMLVSAVLNTLLGSLMYRIRPCP